MRFSLTFFFLFFSISFLYLWIYVQYSFSEPFVYDPSFKVEKLYEGLQFPVSMSFLAPDDILVLEKNTGTVHRIIDGKMVKDPVLNVNVDNSGERGLVGSTIFTNSTGNLNIFLYFTEITTSSLQDNDSGIEILGNRLYKYDFLNDTLVNPKLILDLPSNNYPVHIGGKMTIGPDRNLYLVVGDLYANNAMTQNIINGTSIDGSGGILKIPIEGDLMKNIAFGKNSSLTNYFAYGIRNSFGMDFDPITGYLWDTENGPGYGDEINLVEPGFNSGWKKVQGIWEPVKENPGNLFSNFTELVNFNNYGNYSNPKLTWLNTIGITAIKFFNSSNLGKNYQNDMFVGDFNYGNIYHFELDGKRKNIIHDSSSIDTIKTKNSDDVLIFYGDPLEQCSSLFSCTVDYSIDLSKNIQNKLLMTSTPVTDRKWSWIFGKEFEVTPGEIYELITSMKLGETVNQSHIAVYGFNNSSKLWESLESCPRGINGPIEWTQFFCNFEIPVNISKIQPIINGGFSSLEGYEGSSWFNKIQLFDKPNNVVVDLFPDLDFSTNIFGRGFGHISDIQVGPEGDLYILAVNPDDVRYLQSYDGEDLEKAGAIYKIVKK